MKSSILILILGLVTRASAAPRQVRFLAVGDPPPYRQEIRDGVSRELEPPAGSIPPREISAGTATARLRLGMISRPVAVPAGNAPLVLQAGAKPWLSAAVPEDGDFLLLLWRDAEGGWDRPRALAIPDGAEAAPAGSLRLVNVAPFEARVVLGSERLLLEPGKSVRRELAAEDGWPLQVLLQDRTGTLRRQFSSTVTCGPGERGLVVIYRADGRSPRRPVKVLVRREPVP